MKKLLKSPNDDELKVYIKKNYIISEYDDYMGYQKIICREIYLPFFVDYKETTIDMNIINKLNLKNYSLPKIEKYSNNKELMALKFSYKNIECVDMDVAKDNSLMKESKLWGEEQFIDGCISNIKSILETKIIVEPNMGFCDKCDDCHGYVCGDITYHILGWAGRIVKGNNLRNVKVINI